MMGLRQAAVLLVVSAMATGCATGGGEPAAASAEAAPHAEHAAMAAAPNPWAGVTDAVAAVQPASGSKVSGWVRFTQTADGVLVTAEIDGLKPNARHAFHVHEFGDITSADAKSAGGHYNPEGHQHAGPDAAMRHAGDLGNIDADDKGHARYERSISGITIAGDRNPVLGRSVIIHAGEDDLTSQPAGNAGDRIGCGVIGVAKPAAPAAK
jgi:Cu-Zn family superoxide dismutase